MRVIFTKNHHVQTGERSRRMYKRGREYDVPNEVGKAAIEAISAAGVTGHAPSRRAEKTAQDGQRSQNQEGDA